MIGIRSNKFHILPLTHSPASCRQHVRCQVRYSRVQLAQQFRCFRWGLLPSLMVSICKGKWPVWLKVKSIMYVCVQFTSSESHSLSQMINFNLDSHFNHAKVLACLTPPNFPQPPLQKLQPETPLLVYLPSSVWCLDAGTQEKPPTDVVIDLWLSCYFCYCCCSQSGLLMFEVLHSIQQCSPLLKQGLTSWLRFQMSPQEPEDRGWRWLHQKRTFQPSASFATVTNLELWFHEWIEFTHQMLVNYL